MQVGDEDDGEGMCRCTALIRRQDREQMLTQPNAKTAQPNERKERWREKRKLIGLGWIGSDVMT